MAPPKTERIGQRTPSNKRLQLTPNSSFQSIRGTALAADVVNHGTVWP
jgi:hypothetical protein